MDESLDTLHAAIAEAGVDHSAVLASYPVNPERPSAARVVRAVQQVRNLGNVRVGVVGSVAVDPPALPPGTSGPLNFLEGGWTAW